MDATLVAKLVGTVGLSLDVIGACCLYYYAFKLPPKLKEQESLPGTHREELDNGVKRVVITAGVAVDIHAVTLNRYYEYKNLLYGRRIAYGFWALIGGFCLQALGNFVGYGVGATIGWWGAAVAVLAVVGGWGYLFAYLSDIPELSDSAGKNFSVNVGDDGFTIDSDAQFKAWLQRLAHERAKVHLP